jgi:hypothetical protein
MAKKRKGASLMKKNYALLKNKKGLLGDIWSSIGNFFQGITHILPKPILFAIFLFIILLIGVLLTFIFNFVGIYCTSAEVPVSIGFNPLATASLIGDIPDEATAGTNDIAMDKILFVSSSKGTSCSVKLNGGTINLPNGNKTNITSPRWFYTGIKCSECLIVKIDNPTGQSWLQANIDPETGICYGNAYKIIQKSAWEKLNCNENAGGSYCQPPIGYYYDYQTNTYKCDDNTCKLQTIGQKWDNKLKDKGANPLYPEDLYGTSNTLRYDKMISIQCFDMRPRLALFGKLNIFDYKIWIFITIIAIMIWALINFG